MCVSARWMIETSATVRRRRNMARMSPHTAPPGKWGPGSVSGSRGLPGASVVAVGAVLLLLLSLVSWCSLMFLFGCTRGCWVPCVLLCLFPPLPCALGVSCRRRLFGALFVRSRSCCWSALVGRLSVLECAFWGFLLLFALLHLFPLLRLFL